MNQITQKDLIKLIEEKRDNAERQVYINTTGNGNLAKGTANLSRETNELNGEAKAYHDLFCYLNDVEIVPEIKQGETICECYDPVYKRCNGTKEREECYCAGDIKECTHYPEKRSMTTKPKEENENKTCYECASYQKCKEQNIACDGSGWKPVRNDRFREFERTDDDGNTITVTIDAKEISTLVEQKAYVNTINDTYEVIILGNGGMLFFKRFIEEPRAKAYYKELLEWWKYWKQN